MWRSNPVYHAFFYGLLAAFFWGTHSVIVRYLTRDLHGIPIAALRLYIAALALYLILKINRQPISIKLTDRMYLVTMFGTVTNYIFFHIGLEHTTASNAMLLENLAPFFVLLFLFLFFKERVRTIDIVATVVAVAGVFFTVRHDLALSGEGLNGDILEICAAVTWAVFVIGSSRALRTTNSPIERVGFLFNVFIVSAILLTPLALFYPFDITMEDIIFLVLLGVFPTAVAYFLWYEAVARVSTISAALLFNLSIVFTFINAYVFLGEEMLASMIIGAALIVIGITLSKLGPQKS